MTPDRKFFQSAWPTFAVVFPLDFILTVAIWGLASAVALVSYQPYVFRARLTEAVIAAGNTRYELIERLAHSGDSLEIPIANYSVSTATVDALLSGSVTPQTKAAGREGIDLRDKEAAKEALQKELKAKEAGEGSSRYVSAARIVGSAIVVSGNISGRAYEFGMFPAAHYDVAPSVYTWHCGRNRLPEGWLAQPPALTTILPDHLLERPCRRGGGT